MKHLITLLLLTCSLALVGCGDAPGPGETVEAFALAMEAGDAETVKKLCPGLVSIMGSDKVDGTVAEGAANMAKEGGIKSITIDEEEIDGKTAKVTATIEKGNGEKETDDFDLVQIKDQWVITLDNEGKGGDDDDEEAADAAAE